VSRRKAFHILALAVGITELSKIQLIPANQTTAPKERPIRSIELDGRSPKRVHPIGSIFAGLLIVPLDGTRVSIGGMVTGSQGFLVKKWEIIPRRFPMWPCLRSGDTSPDLIPSHTCDGGVYPSNRTIMERIKDSRQEEKPFFPWEIALETMLRFPC